jgi:stress-induced-phosphoprotein 1
VSNKFRDLGNKLFTEKDFDGAVHYYTRALLVEPTNHVILTNRSAAYFNLGNFEDALVDALQSIDLRPSWLRGYDRAIAACEKLGRSDKAESLSRARSLLKKP